VLMDVQMPEMDGLTATRKIRQNPQWAQLPIIAMTANAFEEDRRQCFDAGMDDFITKPFDPDHLYSLLLKWLRMRAGS
jgi:CheY-like chemotaxis protein